MLGYVLVAAVVAVVVLAARDDSPILPGGVDRNTLPDDPWTPNDRGAA